MNFKLIVVTTISLFTLALASCSSDDCSSDPIEVKNLEDFECANAQSNVTVLSSNEFELIRSQTDYDLLISDRCEPVIDWAQYDLVAGTFVFNKGVSSIQKSLIMNCARNRLELTFTIQLNLTQVAPQITLNALIPKLKDDIGIFVDTVILE